VSKLNMIKIGNDGQPLPEGSTESHVAVLLPQVGLMFTATDVATDVPHAQCEAACKASTVAGFTDWQMPTSDELMLLVDHSRREPAIDIDYFRDIESDWYWTRTPWINSNGEASASVAWLVGFYYGVVGYDYRGSRGCALAVRRAGQ